MAAERGVVTARMRMTLLVPLFCGVPGAEADGTPPPTKRPIISAAETPGPHYGTSRGRFAIPLLLRKKDPSQFPIMV